MPVAIIAAMSRNRVIGMHGEIPWHLPEDLRRFREMTTGHTIVMGRQTFESIGKALPGRRTVIISRNRNYKPEGCLIAGSIAEAIAAAKGDLVFFCGGGEIYSLAMGIADIIYLTVIDIEIEGDTYFPSIPPDFSEVSRETLSTSPSAEFIEFRRLPKEVNWKRLEEHK